MINPKVVKKFENMKKDFKIEEYKFYIGNDEKNKKLQGLVADIIELFNDFYKKYKIKYEFMIKNNKIYIILHTGLIITPPVFREVLNQDELKIEISRYKIIIDFIKKILNKVENNLI